MNIEIEVLEEARLGSNVYSENTEFEKDGYLWDSDRTFPCLHNRVAQQLCFVLPLALTTYPYLHLKEMHKSNRTSKLIFKQCYDNRCWLRFGLWGRPSTTFLRGGFDLFFKIVRVIGMAFICDATVALDV